MSAAQRTPEWYAERLGKATSSRAADILAKIKVGEAKTRQRYRSQLVVERLTQQPVPSYQNAAMLHGIETEAEARMSFESERGVLVQEVGFCVHPNFPMVGASPDGTIEDNGLLELKCPESMTHLDWMERGEMPTEHIPQVQFQMWVTGRKWVDFVSYDPRFPSGLQLFVVRVLRDDAYITELEKEVRVFLASVDSMVERLLKRKT